MQIIEVIRSAFTALRSNLLRTLLTMLGIIIGIASVIIIISIGEGATASITTQISSFGSNRLTISPGAGSVGPARGQGSVTTLTYDDAKAIRDTGRVSNVDAVSAEVQKQMQVIADGENTNVRINGVEDSYAYVNSLEIALGSFIDKSDLASLGRVAVIGPTVATDLFGEGSDPLGKTIKIDSKSFRVIGVTQTKDSTSDEAVYVPLTTAMKILLGQNHVQTIAVQAITTEGLDVTMEEIKTLLLERHRITDPELADFNVRSSQDIISTVGNITNILTILLAAIASISLVVGGIGIMNIMLVTVTERTKEIGLLKSIGAKRGDILTQFLIEAIILTLLGGLVGMTLGIGLSYVIAKIIQVPFIIGYTSILLAVGVSTAVGIIFGLYPAAKASRLSPIDALRYE